MTTTSEWASRPVTATRRTHPFETRAVDVLDRVGNALGWEPWAGGRLLSDHTTTVEALDFACAVAGARVREQGATLKRSVLVELTSAVVELETVRQELRDVLLAERYAALVGVQTGLARLRGIGSVSAMLDKATAEICRACGFDRSILFRVLDSQMVAVSVYYEGHPEEAAALIEVGKANPADLNHMLLETEMIRRRVPMLVSDPQSDPRVYHELARATDTRSYVAAPIMPEGRVIGFLHADRYYQGRAVDEFDRDLVFAFAEGFGYAFERTVLLERLRAQRDQVRGMVGSTEQLLDELCDTEIEVARVNQEDAQSAGRTTALLTGSGTGLEQLLTRREVEVINLMAAGETNAGIASRLVISDGTVKSHVKHILRKLRAANRAEAVSRYMRIASLDDGE